MPLNLDNYDLRRLKEIVDALPEAVKSGTIVIFENGPTFTFKWNENDGHVLTWKEPRK